MLLLILFKKLINLYLFYSGSTIPPRLIAKLHSVSAIRGESYILQILCCPFPFLKYNQVVLA